MSNNNTQNKYFINFILGYFKALHQFSLLENYHLHTFIVAKEAGYNKFIAIVDGGLEFNYVILLVKYL